MSASSTGGAKVYEVSACAGLPTTITVEAFGGCFDGKSVTMVLGALPTLPSYWHGEEGGGPYDRSCTVYDGSEYVSGLLLFDAIAFCLQNKLIVTMRSYYYPFPGATFTYGCVAQTIEIAFPITAPLDVEDSVTSVGSANCSCGGDCYGPTGVQPSWTMRVTS